MSKQSLIDHLARLLRDAFIKAHVLKNPWHKAKGWEEINLLTRGTWQEAARILHEQGVQLPQMDDKPPGKPHASKSVPSQSPDMFGGQH